MQGEFPFLQADVSNDRRWYRQRPSLGGVYYYSMALVIMGGLALSTFLTLILLPTATTLTEDSTDWALRMFKKLGVLLRVKKKQEILAD